MTVPNNPNNRIIPIGRAARGARVFFWSELLTYVVVSAASFAAPFVFGSHGNSEGRIADLLLFRSAVGVIPAIGAIGMLVGIRTMTFRWATRSMHDRMSGLCVSLGLLCWVEFLFRWLVVTLEQTAGRPHSFVFWSIRHVIYVCLVVVLFLYIRRSSAHYKDAVLARTSMIAAYAVAMEHIGRTWIWTVLSGYVEMRHTIYVWVNMCLEIGIGILALSVVWKYGTLLVRVAAGRCVLCGYSLHGIRGERCPECGVLSHVVPETK